MRARKWFAFASGTRHRFHAEVAEQGHVVVDGGIRRGEKFFSGENGIRAGEEAEGDGFTRKFVASAREAHAGSGHEDPCGGDGTNHYEWINLRSVGERSSVDAREHVDGNAFGMRIEICELVKEADAVLIGFADAEDSAAANGDARFANARDGFEAVFVNARGDDVAVK